MNEKRTHIRIDCATKCILYHDGSKFRGVVENLSVSGALVRIGRDLTESIHAGDNCSLLLCNLPTLSYSRHASQVKHLDSTAIGLQFLFSEDQLRPRIHSLPWHAAGTHSAVPAIERKSAPRSAEGQS